MNILQNVRLSIFCERSFDTKLSYSLYPIRPFWHNHQTERLSGHQKNQVNCSRTSLETRVNNQEFRTVLVGGKPESLLVIPFEDGSVISSLRELLPGTRIEVLQKQHLAGLSVLQLVRKVRERRWDAVVCSLHQSTVNRTRSSVEIVVGMARARSRYLRIREDAYERITRRHLLLEVLPKMLLGIVLGCMVVAAMYVTVALAPLFARRQNGRPIREKGTVLFLRTDLAGVLKAGGSVSHIKGMIQAFLDSGFHVVYISDAKISSLPPVVEQLTVAPVQIFDFFDELQLLMYNIQFMVMAGGWIRSYEPCLVYQRHGILNISGGLVSKTRGIPFVLEANDSEVWVKSHWSRLLMVDLAKRCESTALHLADRVAVISKGVQEQLAPYGIPERKFLLNPNGVNPQEFHPGIAGTAIRQRYGFGRNIVVGFIGTFTKWHGVEVLVDAAIKAIRKSDNIVFLLIGDGDLKSALENKVDTEDLNHRIVFTGLIAHNEAPQFLAACDILVSPHLGFGDTEKFFGSPTKLFEYMAMGKAIIASNLEQIGMVIEDGRTGLHCTPGDSVDLAEKILLVAGDEELRRRLGAKARSVVEKEYTWSRNVERILAALESSHE